MLRVFPLRYRVQVELDHLRRVAALSQAAVAWVEPHHEEVYAVWRSREGRESDLVLWAECHREELLVVDGRRWVLLSRVPVTASRTQTLRGALWAHLAVGDFEEPGEPTTDIDASDRDAVLTEVAHSWIDREFSGPTDFLRAFVRAYGPVAARSSEPRLAAGLLRAHLDRGRFGEATLALGVALERRHGRHQLAERLGRTSYEFALRADDLDLATRAALVIARTLRMQAKWAAAERWYGQAEMLADSSGAWTHLARAREGTGNLFRERGQLPRARDWYQTALRAAELSGDSDVLCSSHASMAGISTDLGDASAVVRHAVAGLRHAQDPDLRVTLFAILGEHLHRAGSHDLAAECHERAVAIPGARPDPHQTALANLAEVYACLDRPADAEAVIRRIDWSGRKRLARHTEVQVLMAVGRALARVGQPVRARRFLRRAWTIAREHGIHEWAVKLEAEAEAPATPLPSHLIAEARKGIRLVSYRS